jgi:hypothetical protein
MEQNRIKRGKIVHDTLAGTWAGKLSDTEIQQNIKRIESENNIKLGGKDQFEKLLRLFENIAQESNDENSSKVAVMTAWLRGDNFDYLKSDFDEWTQMPYETTCVRVPVGYDDILRSYYGDYMKPVRGAAVHEYPIYRELEEKFRKRYGKNPTLRYHFDKERFCPRDARKSFADQQKELLPYLYKFHEKTQVSILNQRTDEAANFLQTCQNAAITIGNAIEGKYGDGTEAVHALEEYCEKIYEASVNWQDNSRQGLDDCLATAENSIDELTASSDEEILFLLCRSSWWDSIKDVYSSASNKSSNVKAIPIPYSFLDHTKMIVGWQSDLESFSKIPELKEHLTSFEEYKLEKKRPDKIVIQFPYDGYSGILAIPRELFTERLLDYTDELIYVPYLEPDAPESTKDVAYAAMQELLEQPAVFNADKILIGSEELRSYYVKKLVDMTDGDLKQYWDKRISLKENV